MCTTERSWTHGWRVKRRLVKAAISEAVFIRLKRLFGNDFRRKEIIEMPSRRPKAKITHQKNWEHLAKAI
jgi:hypothetical protein